VDGIKTDSNSESFIVEIVRRDLWAM
jgi:hypothetical protein